MRKQTEERLVDIIGWLWVASVIFALILGGSMALATTVSIGIAAAAVYFGYKYWYRPNAFWRRHR